MLQWEFVMASAPMWKVYKGARIVMITDWNVRRWGFIISYKNLRRQAQGLESPFLIGLICNMQYGSWGTSSLIRNPSH